MKLLRFMILLVQRGSFHLQPVDFEGSRKESIAEANLPVLNAPVKKSSHIKSYLKRTTIGFTLSANLAYLRDSGKVNNMYFISDSHKVVYIRILKCASTSMLKEFLPLVDERLNVKHLSATQIDAVGYYVHRNVLKGSCLAYTKFALVRNPFHRIVSAYLDLFDPKATTFSYASYWFGILKREMTFKDFIKTISKVPPSLLGPHFIPQWSVLKKTSFLKDILIYRIEKDMESLLVFLSQYNVLLPNENKHHIEYDFRSYYDAETFALVSDMYREDVVAFGYQADCVALEEYISAL